MLDINGEIVPIDVKKEKSSLNSINEFRLHNKNTLVIKVSSNIYGYNKEK